MPKRKIIQMQQPPEQNSCKIESENKNDRVVSMTRSRRRILSLNRFPDQGLNSSNHGVKSHRKEPSFVKTRFMRNTCNTSNNGNYCFKNKISGTGSSKTNSSQCNVDVTGNSAPHNYTNECSNTTENGPSTTAICSKNHIKQLNNIDSSHLHCSNHVVQLLDTTLGDEGQRSMPRKKLDCEDEPEPVLGTQNLSLGLTQNSEDPSEIQWDCQSPQLMREVKQLQGLYGVEEIRKVVSNFSDFDVKLQKPTIPELKLYLPVKNETLLARNSKHQKAKVRAGMRVQQKVYGRESAQAILQWLQNKAALPLPDDAFDKTAALEKMRSLPAGSHKTPNISPIQDGDFNMNIQADVFQKPLEVDETVTYQSRSIPTSAAADPSVIGAQVFEPTQERTPGFKTLDQIQTLSIADDVCGKLMVVDEVLDGQDNSVSTVLFAFPRKPASAETEVNSLHVQTAFASSLPATEDDAFSDDDGFLLGVDETLDCHVNPTAPSSMSHMKPASVEAAMNSLHVQTAITGRLSATEDGVFSDDFLLEVDEILDCHFNPVAPFSSVAPASIDAAVNSLHVQTAMTSSISATDNGAIHFSTSDDVFQQLVDIDKSSENKANTVFISSSALPRETASVDAKLSSARLKSAITSGISATEAFDNSISDDDDFILEVDKTPHSQANTVVTSSSAPAKKTISEQTALNSDPSQSAILLSVSAKEDCAFSDSVYDDDDDFLLEVDNTSDSQANTVFTSSFAAAKRTISLQTALNSDPSQAAVLSSETLDRQTSAVSTSSPALYGICTAVKTRLNPLHKQSAMSPGISATEDDTVSLISNGDFQQLQEVKTLVGQVSTVVTSATSRTAPLNILHRQSALASSTSTTDYDGFDVSISDGDLLLEYDKTLDRHADSFSSSKTQVLPKKTAAECVVAVQIDPDMTENLSKEKDNDFDVIIPDDESHLLLKDDEILDGQANILSTSAAISLHDAATSVETSFKTLQIQQSDIIQSVSVTQAEFANFRDDDFEQMLEVGDILACQINISSPSAVDFHDKTAEAETLMTQLEMIHTASIDANFSDEDFEQMIEADDASASQINILSTSSVDHCKRTAEPETMEALPAQSDIIHSSSVSPDEDANFPNDDFEYLIEVNESECSQTHILTSTPAALPEKTARAETLKTQKIQNVSMTSDEDANFPNDDFEYLIEVNESEGGQTHILTSTPAALPEKTARAETLKTQKIQNVSMTPDEDANFPNDDFEYLIEVNESEGGQTHILTSTPAALPEKTARAETLKTQKIQNVSMTPDEDANFPNDDFEYLIEVNESEGGQTHILTSTPAALPEKTARAETLKTQKIQNVSMTPDEDANFPNDDFEHLIEINESLGSQINISAAELFKKTADIVETIPAQSDAVQNVSMTPDEDSNFSEEFLTEVNKFLDRQVNILSTSTAEAETLETPLIENVSRTQDDAYFPDYDFECPLEAETLETPLIQNVSRTQDDANFLDDDFECSLEAETLETPLIENVSRTQDDANFLGDDFECPLEAETSETPLIQNVSRTQDDANFLGDDFECFLEAETLETTLIQNVSVMQGDANFLGDDLEYFLEAETLETTLIQNVSRTQDDADFPDDDFECLLEAERLESPLIQNVSRTEDDANFPDDDFECSLEAETLETTLIQNVSRTQNYANFPDDDFECLLEVNDSIDSQTNILSTAHLLEGTTEAQTLETLQIQSVSVTQDEDANFSDDDFEFQLEVNECLDSETNIIHTAANDFAGGSHKPASSLCNETSKCKLFDICQSQKSSIPDIDVVRQLLDEILHSQEGCIFTSVAAIPGVVLSSVSDNVNTSLSEMSQETSQMQSSVSMNISKSQNITDESTNHVACISISTNITHGDHNHSAFTFSKQFNLSKLTEPSSSSRAVNNTPSYVNSPRRFRFKRITPLQRNSRPWVSTQNSLTPHF